MFWLIPGFLATAAKALGLGFSLRLPFRRWLAVKIWLLLGVLQDLALYTILWSGADPRTSLLYAQFYYWSDLICAFAGLLVLLRLAEVAFKNTRVDLPMLRGISIAILFGTIVMSFGLVFARLGKAALTLPHLIAFANEAEQNLAAAGMLAAVVLIVAVSMLRVPGVRIRRLTSGFGIYYSAGAIGGSSVELFGRGAHFVVQIFSLASLALLAFAMSERDESQGKPPSAKELERAKRLRAAVLEQAARRAEQGVA